MWPVLLLQYFCIINISISLYHRIVWNHAFFFFKSWWLYLAALFVRVLSVMEALRAAQSNSRQQQQQIDKCRSKSFCLAAAMKMAGGSKTGGPSGRWHICWNDHKSAVRPNIWASHHPWHQFKHWWATFKGEQQRQQRQQHLHLLPADGRWTFTPSHHGWLWGDPAECRGVRTLPEGHAARAKPS